MQDATLNPPRVLKHYSKAETSARGRDGSDAGAGSVSKCDCGVHVSHASARHSGMRLHL